MEITSATGSMGLPLCLSSEINYSNILYNNSPSAEINSGKRLSDGSFFLFLLLYVYGPVCLK